jgi:hypothetical protein
VVILRLPKRTSFPIKRKKNEVMANASISYRFPDYATNGPTLKSSRWHKKARFVRPGL